MKKTLIFVLALFIAFATSCSLFKDKEKTKENPTVNNEVVTEQEEKEIVLYYSNKSASGLCADKRMVPKDRATDVLFVMDELLKGSENEELINVIPEGTVVNSCKVEDGLCTLDLSKEFISKRGTANEQMEIYSVVNTICAIEGINEVKFLIDGEPVMIFGSYIFDEPFTADETMVR